MASRFALAGLVVALLLGAALRLTPAWRVEDLRPRPDALEYEEAARSLAAGDGYALRIGAQRYPPRFPPGFALLLAPYYRFVDDAPGAGVVVVQLCAAAAIAGGYALAAAAGGARAGVAAAAIIALSPLHVRWSRAVMGDVPASAALVWLAVWTVAALRRGARGVECFLLGLVAGLAMNLRVCIGLIVPLALALFSFEAARAGVAGLPSTTRPAKGYARGLLFGVGAALGALSLALSNLALYGSPLRSGYDYWAPGSYFSVRYLFGATLGAGRIAGGNVPYYGTALLGFGTLYPWPVAALAVLGAVGAWRARPAEGERAVRAAVLSSGVVAGFAMLHAFYFWQWDRFLLPAVPFVAALAGLAFAGFAPRAVRLAAPWLAVLGVALLVRSTSYEPPDPIAFDVRALQALDAVAGDRALVLADTNPFFFARHLRARGERTWLPLLGDEHCRVIARLGRQPLAGGDAPPPAWLQQPVAGAGDFPRAMAAIDAALAGGREVFFSRQFDVEVPFMDELEASLAERYSLETLAPVDPDPDAPKIYRVRPRSGS